MAAWQRRSGMLAGVVLCALVACNGPGSGAGSEGRPLMASLRVRFAEGFDQDTVVVRVDGQEVARHGPITTRYDVEPPLAWSADIPVQHDTVSIEVSVERTHASGSIRLSIKESPQVDISMQGNRVVLRGSPLVPSLG